MKSLAENLPPLPDALDEAGLTVKYEKSADSIIAKLLDTEGKEVARLPFSPDRDVYESLKTLTPMNTLLPEDLRGKGIASDLYKRVEDYTGTKIVPDDVQTPAGHALHEKYGFGKKFGMSEQDLMSKLDLDDRMKRNARKTALSQLLNAKAAGGNPNVHRVLGEVLGYDFPHNVADLYHHAVEQASLPDKTTDLNKLKSLIPKFLPKVKSLAPLATGAAGLAYSGLSEAADAESEGSSSEQGQLLREIDELQRRKKSISQANNLEKEALSKIYENLDTGKTGPSYEIKPANQSPKLERLRGLLKK